MYFVDRDKIERLLLYMDGLVQELDQHQYASFMEKLSLERIVHMTIESMLDVGNMMIDGFIMRDPGSYNDIIDILVDENVLPEKESDGYKEVIGLRKMLVKGYLSVDHNHILEIVKKNHYSLEVFSQRMRDYFDNEPGAASAFSK